LGEKICVGGEINVSHAGDPVHAGDEALTRETPVQRGRVCKKYTKVSKISISIIPRNYRI
jgi:hypothetical protein